MLVLSACVLDPSVKFSQQSTNGIVLQNGYKIKVIPITRELLAKLKQPISTKNKVIKSPKTLANTNYDYKLGVSDVLLIKLWNSAGSSAKGSSVSAVINTDGTIYFPYVGEIKVTGLNVTEVRRKIHNKLTSYFDNPKVSVFVKSYNSKYVTLTGQVTKPGRFPITNKKLTIFELINSGLRKEGAWKEAKLTRINGTVENIDLNAMVNHGDMSQNYFLSHGDRLHVPTAVGRSAFLLGGGFVKPETLSLQNIDISLAEVIGRSGGISPTANTNAIYVFRKSVNSPQNVLAYQLNASSPVSMLLAADFMLKPKDIVYADSSGLVRWNKVISLLLPSAGLPSVTNSALGSAMNLIN